MTPGWIYATCVCGGGIGGYAVAKIELRLQGRKPVPVRWRAIARVVIGLALIALVVFATVRAQARNECLEGFFTQVAGSLAERSQATQRDLASQTAAWESLADGRIDRAAITDRLAALAELERSRAASPLPSPPRC